MRPLILTRWNYGWLYCLLLTLGSGVVSTRAQSASSSPLPITVLELEGRVEAAREGAAAWDPCYTNQVLRPGDRFRTHARSRVTLRWSDASTMRIGELTEMLIQAPPDASKEAGFNLLKGILYFFHRDKAANLRIGTRTASAAVRGTEFALEALDDGRTILTLFDGEVELSNEAGSVILQNGERGVAVPGQVPTKTALITAELVDAIQWCLYYPAVLDLNELPLTAGERQLLNSSLEAYRRGELLQALARYPEGREPISAAEKVYLGAVLLSVGRVDQTEALLEPVASDTREHLPAALARSLRQVIAAAKGRAAATSPPPFMATEWLAESYSRQARADLEGALAAARMAVQTDPNFGFGWARVAELEFSFGSIGDALEALDTSLRLSPGNAEALALKGFLLGAQNKIRQALEYFDRAIAVDGALGNAWLGRGLCRIRQGKTEAGRQDLQTAVTLEPQRALLRSYLAKAYGDSGDRKRATNELAIAKRIDPNDPTAWLYSALLNQQYNRINEAIGDLEKSQELNDNRRIYRSKLLLDQDRAVRSANLARVYADSDLGDVAVREAGRGVSADYANYSAHAFLANSYEVERRANLSDTRLETASFNEYLLANLLGPANGRLLAQPVSQLEYSSLLEQDRLGLIANTEYFSRGAWHHSSAQYGTLNGSSYSLDAEYRTEPGERVNQDHEILQLEGKFKHDFTPADSVYLHVLGYWADGGDIAQRFDEREIRTSYRFEEKQTPTALAGYHHQWSPGNHTLLLGGRFDDTFQSTDQDSPVYVLDRFFGTVTGLVPLPVRERYLGRVEVYTAEAQQIAVVGAHTLIAGTRLELSNHDAADRVPEPDGFDPNSFLLGTNRPVSDQNGKLQSYLTAIYAYDYFQLSDTLQLIGGLNYTHQTIPANTSTAPISSERDRQARVSPRAGIVWSPSSSSSVRGSYAKSLTGSGLGQSVRLEPSQTAGMLQVIRNPVPPSLVGHLDGADVQTAQLLWEGRFRKTYVSLGGQWLSSERTRRLGLFLSDPLYDPPPSFGLIKERVRFNEYALDASAHQLVGEEWSFGAQYRLAYARLERSVPEYIGLGPPPSLGGVDDQTDWRGWLHALKLTGLYRHQSGLFARAEGIFFAQDREQDGLSVADDTFWQLNLIAGYRFPRQKAEVAVGVLNVLDRDYRLDPINQHIDPPRSRTFYARLLINF